MLLWLDGIQSFTVTKALNSFQDRANVVLWKKAVFVLWANPGYTRRRAVRAHTWPSKACESMFVLLWFNIVLIKWNWIHLCSFDYTCTVHIHDAISYGLLCCNYVWNGILFLQYGVCIVYRPSIMCSFYWILCVHRLAGCFILQCNVLGLTFCSLCDEWSAGKITQSLFWLITWSKG